MLSVIVHTEEEFDWNQPFDRNATTVSHMRHIDRIQEIFDNFHIVPTYVCDYSIANQKEGYLPLRQFAAEGRALIGAHLHPWVTPPLTEELSRRNSYPGNLPLELERAKFVTLTERITENFGVRPTVYLAGRYGNGPNSARILEELGYEVDASVNVPMDFSRDGGPDYSSHTNHPFWFGEKRRLLGLCYSGDFLGWLPAGRAALHRISTLPALEKAHIPGILARLGALDRIGLTPEGYTNQEMRWLTKSLVEDGFRVLVFYFHSPSVAPGFTPYVRNSADLEAFLTNCRDYFKFFMEDIGGVAKTPLQIKDLLAS